MVLAKKKLKQQLRSLLAVSVEAAESRNQSVRSDSGDNGVDQRLRNLKELLISKNRRENRPTRRAGKKKKTKNEELLGEAADGGQASAAPDISKKRKRGDDAEKKNRKNRKKKKNKIKNKKKNTKSEGEEETKAEEISTIEERDEDAGKRVYVGGIPYYSTEDDIRSFFQGCGTVTELDCMIFPESGKFRGIAIVSFKTEAAAKRALALDGSDMGGLFLKIKPYEGAQKPQKQSFSPEIIDGYNRIYVGNLSWEITEEELRKFFLGCKIAAVRFGEDKATGEFKGYAHVDFHDAASLAAALKLDQAELCGRPARISAAVPKKGGTATANKITSPLPGAAMTKTTTSLPSDGTAKTMASSPPAAASAEEKKKKKRQTCYECGVPGHLSSECPQKKQRQES
ncbi:phragmoplastin interacting protein 1 isoform X1 [Wolffia australiana]